MKTEMGSCQFLRDLNQTAGREKYVETCKLLHTSLDREARGSTSSREDSLPSVDNNEHPSFNGSLRVSCSLLETGFL